ncbi:hypothetical protein CFC21_067622 [Triticum aestivum]|uniref:Uncharacterized protein n=3 Tax=Triticum TaxID=4564 RepID=A0A9R0WT05_TRITD|nr:hypothetical protein CFC21_067622 [Triticum aestivum]VAI21788.1 unnamed protein product [Triticum turgidum subsp. durum]
MVPVLSNATALISPSDSRTSPPLTRTPIRAAVRSAQNVATGVDSTSAHGHALTSSTSASLNHRSASRAPSSGGSSATPAPRTTTAGV